MPKVTGLGHVGVFVQDMPTMIDFYRDFLGLQLTNRASDDRIVFFSAHPETEHHELALVKSPDGQKTHAQQISWRVGSLADLKAFHTQIKERGLPISRVVSHGNAFGCYFDDPEGNRLEVYWQTGVEQEQPYGDPIDLEAPASELLATLDKHPVPPLR
jgi:catechol-2,3-dioxygenase